MMHAKGIDTRTNARMSAAAPPEKPLNEIAIEISLDFMLAYAERLGTLKLTCENDKLVLQRAFKRCFSYLTSPGNLEELKYAPSSDRKQVFMRFIEEN